LTYIIDHEHKIKADIRAALQYPIIVVIFLAIAFFVLLTFVIPKFVGIFLAAKLNLPLPTKICIFLYHFLQDYWHLMLGGGAWPRQQGYIYISAQIRGAIFGT